MWGIFVIMGGLMVVGFCYFVFSLIVKFKGVNVLYKVLLFVVVGLVIMVIGLVLVFVVVNMVMGKVGDGSV